MYSKYNIFYSYVNMYSMYVRCWLIHVLLESPYWIKVISKFYQSLLCLHLCPKSMELVGSLPQSLVSSLKVSFWAASYPCPNLLSHLSRSQSDLRKIHMVVQNLCSNPMSHHSSPNPCQNLHGCMCESFTSLITCPHLWLSGLSCL